MKIFCIGYNKTGTTSLYQSIKELGKYNRNAKRVFMPEGELLMHSVAKGNLKAVTDWVEKRNDIELFKDVPFSIPGVWKAIYKKYPDAIYILSERDSSEQWYNSIVNFHRGFYSSDNPSWDDVSEVSYGYKKTENYNSFMYDYLSYTFGKELQPYDKDNFIASYESYNNEIKEFFKDKDNFISINVSNDNDYLKVCSLLGKNPISNKFLKLKVTGLPETW
tara:strand:+ start:808 stop:1467 length:660 start_codon:yes stop_codon:yes gene_type:complete